MEVATSPVLVRIVEGGTLFCHHEVKFQSLVSLLTLEQQ
jgi:hypothetical protein